MTGATSLPCDPSKRSSTKNLCNLEIGYILGPAKPGVVAEHNIEVIDPAVFFVDPGGYDLRRRALPRKTEFSDYSDQDIHDIVWAINTTPRKCLGFLSPAEAFIHQLRCCT
jgi:hypothetical protein